MVAVAALALVLAVGDSFNRSFADSAKALLGGDLAVRLSQRDFAENEIEWMRDNSARISKVRIAGALAVAGQRTHLVRIKSVDAAYPLYGALILEDESVDADAVHDALSSTSSTRSPSTLSTTSSTTSSTSTSSTSSTSPTDSPAPLSALISKELATLLTLQVGARFDAGGLSLQVAGIILKEPDPDSRIWMSAALVLVGDDATDALTAPGMLGRSVVRVQLRDGDTPQTWRARLDAAFPAADWRVREATSAMRGLRRFVERMRDFLSLMSLAAMLMAGLGVGRAAAAFLRARIRAIAVIKMLGGDARLIARVYLTIVFIFILGGALGGAFVGGALLFWAAPLLTPSLPITLAAEWPWSAMARALAAAMLLSAGVYYAADFAFCARQSACLV